MLRNSWVAPQLAASQEGLGSMKLVRYNGGMVQNQLYFPTVFLCCVLINCSPVPFGKDINKVYLELTNHLSDRSGPGSIPGLVKWDLWWTKWRWGRFSPSTSVSPANLHSTNCSTVTLTYHLGLVQPVTDAHLFTNCVWFNVSQELTTAFYPKPDESSHSYTLFQGDVHRYYICVYV
jgi:hypothetical protein